MFRRGSGVVDNLEIILPRLGANDAPKEEESVQHALPRHFAQEPEEGGTEASFSARRDDAVELPEKIHRRAVKSDAEREAKRIFDHCALAPS